MARIFSIEFTYEGITHNAMVSVRPTPFFTEYSISMLPDDIQRQLPGNIIISGGPNQFRFRDQKDKVGTELMEEIIRAVSQHLMSSTV